MARTTEEQITQLKNCVLGWQPALSPSARQALAAIAKAYIEEAEQRGYERAQAECADDTKRMDDMEEILKTHELGRTFEGFAFSKDIYV